MVVIVLSNNASISMGLWYSTKYPFLLFATLLYFYNCTIDAIVLLKNIEEISACQDNCVRATD